MIGNLFQGKPKTTVCAVLASMEIMHSARRAVIFGDENAMCVI